MNLEKLSFSEFRSDHEILNRIVFSSEQRIRVESDRPEFGTPIKTDSGFVLAAYLMPNCSKFVTLIDDSNATWEAYCAEQKDGNA